MDTEPFTNSLDVAILLIAYPANGPSVKTISVQFRAKNVVVVQVNSRLNMREQ